MTSFYLIVSISYSNQIDIRKYSVKFLVSILHAFIVQLILFLILFSILTVVQSLSISTPHNCDKINLIQSFSFSYNTIRGRISWYTIGTRIHYVRRSDLLIF